VALEPQPFPDSIIWCSADTKGFSGLPISGIWADKCGGNGMKTDPYPHPQHIKFISHHLYALS